MTSVTNVCLPTVFCFKEPQLSSPPCPCMGWGQWVTHAEGATIVKNMHERGVCNNIV